MGLMERADQVRFIAASASLEQTEGGTRNGRQYLSEFFGIEANEDSFAIIGGVRDLPPQNGDTAVEQHSAAFAKFTQQRRFIPGHSNASTININQHRKYRD
ncbi:MAG: hypothetical protein IPK53_11060 [bacterium]|nr:hypothetical protein [bacterium]